MVGAHRRAGGGSLAGDTPGFCTRLSRPDLADAAHHPETLGAGDRVVPQDMALCIERRAVYELVVPGRLSVVVNGRF